MKEPIVILHGWGSLMSGEQRFKEVKKMFKKNGYMCFTPDLPGFGQNVLKYDALGFSDYISFVEKYVNDVLKKTKQKKVILIGHSFGGRIAIRFTAQHNEVVAKLILAAPSGIPHALPLKKRVFSQISMILKPLFSFPVLSSVSEVMRKLLYRAIGEMDYYKAGKLRETFKNIYRVSIVADLPRITVPTLLVWGDNDGFVPVQDGMYMKNKMSHATLVTAPGTHKFPYESPKEFVKISLSFLK